MKKFLSINLLLLFATVIIARDIKVPQEYRTIQKAIDAASDGDRIIIASGNYTEYLVINKSISLMGIKPCSIYADSYPNKTARNKFALINIADNEVHIQNINLIGVGLNNGKSKTASNIKNYCTIAIDAKDAIVDLKNVNFNGFTQSYLKMDGGTLDISNAVLSPVTSVHPAPTTGFILDDVGGVSMKNITSVNKSIEHLLAINETYTGSRKSFVIIKNSNIKNTKIDKGRKESYTLSIINTADIADNNDNDEQVEEEIDENIGNLASVPVEDESDNNQQEKSAIQFDGDKMLFTTQLNGTNYEFQLPARLQYQSHKSDDNKLVIAYSLISSKDNYVGIWDNKLKYQAEYKFAKLKVLAYVLEKVDLGIDGLLFIHYKDLAYKTNFAGIFNSKMKYIGQFELTGTSDIKMTFENGNPVIFYSYQGQKWYVKLDRNAKEIKRSKM